MFQGKNRTETRALIKLNIMKDLPGYIPRRLLERENVLTFYQVGTSQLKYFDSLTTLQYNENQPVETLSFTRVCALS